MISVPVPDTSDDEEKRRKADADVRAAIRSYGSRWVLLLPCVMMLILLGLFLSMQPNSRVKVALVVAVLAFCAVWTSVVFAYATLRYRRFKNAGKIVEVHGEDAERFMRQFLLRVELRNVRLAGHDSAVLHHALREAATHDPETDSGVEQRNMLYGTALMAADCPDLSDPSPRS